MNEFAAYILRMLLQPLANYCVRRSHSFQDFVFVAKEAFVTAAEREAERTHGTVNLSRLSVMTGIHRNEVRKILDRESNDDVEFGQSVLSRVIGNWRHHKSFCTKSGQPRRLTFRGEDSRFAELVYSVSKNIRPASVLAELKRLNAVEERGNSLILLRDMVGYSRSREQGFDLLSRDISKLIECVEENLLEPTEPPNMHARTEYDNIARSALPELRRWLLEEGKLFHRRARAFIAEHDLDLNSDLPNEEGGAKVVLGTFSWTSSPDEES